MSKCWSYPTQLRQHQDSNENILVYERLATLKCIPSNSPSVMTLWATAVWGFAHLEHNKVGTSTCKVVHGQEQMQMPQTDKQLVVPIPGNVPAVHLKKGFAHSWRSPSLTSSGWRGWSSPGFYHTHGTLTASISWGGSQSPCCIPPPAALLSGSGAMGGRSPCLPRAEQGMGRPPIWALHPAARRANGGRKPPPARPSPWLASSSGRELGGVSSPGPATEPSSSARCLQSAAAAPAGTAEGGTDAAEPRRRGVPAPRTPLLPGLRRAAAPTCRPSTSSSWKRLCRTARR